jgi:hypothetical protein
MRSGKYCAAAVCLVKKWAARDLEFQPALPIVDERAAWNLVLEPHLGIN